MKFLLITENVAHQSHKLCYLGNKTWAGKTVQEQDPFILPPETNHSNLGKITSTEHKCILDIIYNSATIGFPRFHHCTLLSPNFELL